MKQNLLIFTKTIGDSTRLKILNYLKKECCVSELWKKLDLPQNLVSHHLKVLRNAGLVIAEKRGLKVVYHLNKEILAKNLNRLNNYLK
ncbi:MAG TPA: metalloregulator ArsR/SmtB family transcription factor [Patescibacteria group bacterium]|nr:metalloregulator ArsR/SmtB family transcription factor [Patescibacteria group bacterium]